MTTERLGRRRRGPQTPGAEPSELSRNRAAHLELIAAARSPEASQYLTHGVAAPGQTFGIEVEFNGGDCEAMARDLYRLGITDTSVPFRYNRKPGVWTFESDGSVTGGEIVSPVMTDTPETWDQLAALCDVIKRHGGYADRFTGGHVHVGIASSGMRRHLAPLRRLVQLYSWSEDLMFRLGSAPENYPFHRTGLRGFSYVDPLGHDDVADVRRIRERRQMRDAVPSYCGMAFHHVETPYDTVEFRVIDGSLDAERLQAGIIFCCALMRAAARMSNDEVPRRAHRLGTHMAAARTDQRLLREFADLVLDTPEQRRKAYSVYERTQWQPDAVTWRDVRDARLHSAVAVEAERIRRHMGNPKLSRYEGEQLWEFVDWMSGDVARATRMADLQIRPEVRDALQWWLQQSLHRGAPLPADWENVRAARGEAMSETLARRAAQGRGVA